MAALEAGCLGDRPVVTAAGGRALEGPLALESRLFVKCRVKLFLGLAKGLAAAPHDDPGGLEELIEREARSDSAVRHGRE
jgi:hypothetical protein